MFEDLISIEQELHKANIAIEELKDELQDYKGAVGVLNRVNRDMGYLLKEASFYMKEFENLMPEDDFKKCEQAASKKYENWLKKAFEINAISVDVTLRSP